MEKCNIFVGRFQPVTVGHIKCIKKAYDEDEIPVGAVIVKDGVVVGTVLNNLALEQKLKSEGRKLLRTPVGDKHICDLMFRKGYNLGGEQSGHYIVYPHSTTGDGIMTAMFLAKSLFQNGTLQKIQKLELVPQKAIAEYANPSIMYDKWLRTMIDEAEAELKNKGRIIVRMSGTEPKIRVMVECSDAKKVEDILSRFKKYINSKA